MGRFNKLACVALIAAMPVTLGVAGSAPEAAATTLVFNFNAFDPSIQIIEAPDSVRPGEKFTIRGIAFPTPGAAESHLYVAVAQDLTDGAPARGPSTAIFECIENGEATPFEITGRASGWSGGTIHIGATLVSTDAPVSPEFADEQLVSLEEIEIQVVRRHDHR